MIFVVTVVVGAIGMLLHLLGAPGFGAPVAVPIAAVVAMCAMGVIARLLPPRRAALVAMVPAGLPRPDLVVWATGVCEAAGAVGVLLP
ncbi:MAG: hypothetical protein QM626_01100, partial [Microbacterium sp.]